MYIEIYIYLVGSAIGIAFGLAAVISFYINREKYSFWRWLICSLSAIYIAYASVFSALKIHTRSESIAMSFYVDEPLEELLLRLHIFDAYNIIFFVFLLICGIFLFFEKSERCKKAFFALIPAYGAALWVLQIVLDFRWDSHQSNSNIGITLILLMFNVFDTQFVKKTSAVMLGVVTIGFIADKILSGDFVLLTCIPALLLLMFAVWRTLFSFRENDTVKKLPT